MYRRIRHWQYRTQTYQLSFIHNPTRSISSWSVSCTDSTPDHIHCQFETAYQLSSNYVTLLDSTSVNTPITPLPQWHLQSLVSLFYSSAEEGHGAGLQVSPLFSYLLSASLTTRTSCLVKCRSVSPIIFIILNNNVTSLVIVNTEDRFKLSHEFEKSSY